MTTSTAVVTRQPAAMPRRTSLQLEHRFFTSMAIAMTLVCFAGFAPSYYLKAQFGTPQLKPLVHFHGLVFTSWMLLLIAQTSLVAAGRVRMHRQLGIAGIALAVLMVVSGGAVIYGRATTVDPSLPFPHEMILAFMGLSVVALLTFPALIGAALYFRRNAAAHKRLMLLATTVILAAAVHRLMMRLVDPAVIPPVFFGATDLFIAALGTYDLASERRIHAATLWGGLLVVFAQAGSLLLAGSKTWLAFAHWVTGT